MRELRPAGGCVTPRAPMSPGRETAELFDPRHAARASLRTWRARRKTRAGRPRRGGREKATPSA